MKKQKWLSFLLAGALALTGISPGLGTVQAAGTNVARNKTVVSSGLEVGDGRWTGELAVDGIRDTEASRWSAAKMKESGATEASAQTPQWLEIDLGAETTEVESIQVYFYKKVWATDYRIQTRASGSDEWEDVGTPIYRESSDEQDRTDTFTDIPKLKRYVRFYFEKLNIRAAGVSVSVREIEITGTQSGILPPTIDTAKQAVDQMEDIGEIGLQDTRIPLPEVAEGFTVRVIGSDVPQVVADDGRITSRNIGEREVSLILEVTNEQDPSDRATRAQTVRIPDKTLQYPDQYPQVNRPNEEPKVLPSLQEWYGYEGNVKINEESRILYRDTAQVGLGEVAAQLQEDLGEICGFLPQILRAESPREAKPGDIYLESQQEDLYETGREGYFLVADQAVCIYSSTKTGALYGTVTVEQILWQEEGHSLVPRGVIRDFPNYEIRGLMFDVGRIPHRLQYLKDYTKILKWYKMNEFHLHLNDNYWSDTANGRSPNPEDWENIEAAFRLECESFPGLVPNTKKGAQYDYYNEVYGEPFYTKEEYRDLQNLAMDQGIQVVSEIDTPCHSAAFTRYAYDNPDEIEWLGPIQNPGCFDLISLNTEAADQTERENALRGRTFMRTLLEEYLQEENQTFLGDTVHIGMDEYDFKAGNQEAFRKYINEMSEIVKAHGKKVRMWGALSVFPGATPVAKDIVLDEWATYEDDPIARMKEGYSVVNVPQPYLYTTPGRSHKDMINEQYVYDTWDPTVFHAGQGKIAQKGEPKLLGAKAAVWGDEQREGILEADLHERALRAAAMVSEKTWGGAAMDQTFPEYEKKLDSLREGPGTQIAMTVESKSDLVLDYCFDQTETEDGQLRILDASGNGYDAVAEGARIEKRGGQSVLRLDGNGSIKTPLRSLRYPYTVSFDVAMDRDNLPGARLFDGYDGRLSILDDQGTLGINRSFYQQELGYCLPAEAMRTITLVGTYQTTKLYVDGVFTKILYSRDSGSLTDDFFSSFVFPLEKIGEGFQGYLGNIRVYKKALTPEELGAAGIVPVNAALNCPAYQENGNPSYQSDDLRLHPAWKATDGDGRIESETGVTTDPRSYWNSSDRDTDSLTVDFGKEREISSVEIQWVAGKQAESYALEVSLDGSNWIRQAQAAGNTGITTRDTFETPVSARYLKMQGIKRTGQDYAVQEIRAFEIVDKTSLGAAVREAEKRLETAGADSSLVRAWEEGKRIRENVRAGKAETNQALAELKAVMPDYTEGCICSIDRVEFPDRILPIYTDWDGNLQEESFDLEAEVSVTNCCPVEGHGGQSPILTYKIQEGDNLGEIRDNSQLLIRKTGSLTVSVTAAFAGADPVTKTAVFQARVPDYRALSGLTALADSEENRGKDGPGSNAVDGDESTYWHSNYTEESKKPVISEGIRSGIVLDLGEEAKVGKLEYVPRGDSRNGRITEYRLLFSQTEAGEDFTEIPGGRGTWESSAAKKEAVFAPVKARRIRLEAVHTDGDEKDRFISAAEICLYEKTTPVRDPEPEPKPEPKPDPEPETKPDQKPDPSPAPGENPGQKPQETVRLGAPANVKASSITTKGMKIGWSKVPGAVRYGVYRYEKSAKKWKQVGLTSKSSIKVKKLKAGTLYRYKVAAQGPSGTEGAMSGILTTATKPKKPVLSLRVSGKSAKLKWKKGTKADGYEIRMKAGKGAYKKIAEVKKRSFTGKLAHLKKRLSTEKKRKKETICCFRVRGYKKAGAKKIYGAYSKAVKVRI